MLGNPTYFVGIGTSGIGIARVAPCGRWEKPQNGSAKEILRPPNGSDETDGGRETGAFGGIQPARAYRAGEARLVQTNGGVHLRQEGRAAVSMVWAGGTFALRRLAFLAIYPRHSRESGNPEGCERRWYRPRAQYVNSPKRRRFFLRARSKRLGAFCLQRRLSELELDRRHVWLDMSYPSQPHQATCPFRPLGAV